VAAGKVSRGTLRTDGETAYWTESRPDESGRQVVVASRTDGTTDDVSPPSVNVRTRVHEYGGAACTMRDGVLFYSDGDDERLYRFGPGTDGPVPLTASAPPGTTLRYADLALTPSGHWVLAVEERIEQGDTRHRLVAVSAVDLRPEVMLVDGRDFLAAPRPSDDGRLLAWTAWDHPHMPWDAAELWASTLDEDADGIRTGAGRRLAGGLRGSVGQPRWCRDGGLLFADERRGWWLPVRAEPDDLHRLVAGVERTEDDPAIGRPLIEEEAEFHGPDWVLGVATMAELADGSVVARRRRTGHDELVRLVPPAADTDADDRAEWTVASIEQPCVTIAGVAVTSGGSVWVTGSTPTVAHVVLELGGVGQVGTRPAVRRRSTVEWEPDADVVARAEAFVASGPVVPVPGLVFLPPGPVAGPTEERPPLVVFCHGGPTASAEPGFDAVVQFFASRGLAVAVVDYRGSTGYGRAFRRLLDGGWGVADVDDCIAFARGLAEAGLVDGGRMAIRGTSAGGLTALEALTRGDGLVGAASWYGVTDLEALARDTHAFESRYLDSLVGPWPEAVERYRQRSPLRHPEELSGAVLLLQGREDRVVPVDQAERLAVGLEGTGTPCRLVLFDGEAHGFRRADTIETCLEEELAFYREVFGVPGGREVVPPAPRSTGGTLDRGE
jgi:dipeptidyl aminopeptidase/acylaminoacyl peptidase